MFTAEDPVDVYTRADAIADSALVDVTDTAREYGFRHPVAMTRAAHDAAVRWTDAEATRTGAVQDEAGRLWDVLTMLRCAIRRATTPADEVAFSVLAVAPDRRSRRARPLALKATVGGAAPHDPAPVLTILLPHED